MKHFEELLLSLGASSSKALIEERHWTLWQAEFRTPITTVRGNYLYLKSSCPLQEASPKNLSNISAHVGSDGYQVVLPPKSDLARDLKATASRFRASVAKTTQELLEEHLLKGITYRATDREEFFISPTVRGDGISGSKDGLPFLTRWLLGEEYTEKRAPVALLCADGGIGKTTLARELCDSIRVMRPRVVPLLIESSQWKNLATTGLTLDTLWDIAIARRLEHGNLLRSNPAALRVLMQEGLLVVIFDGFDELAALSSDKNRPQEILAELTDLFTPEDEEPTARVILTSRTTYWKSISEALAGGIPMEVFRLSGFDNQQRKDYFERRLVDPAQRDLAQRLARQVSGAIYDGGGKSRAYKEDLNEDRLAGTPFILSLIAHYVQESEDENLSPYEADPLEPLILGICRRENIRQELRIAPDRQMAILEDIFRECENEIKVEDVNLILQMHEVEDVGARERFEHHFLLQRAKPSTLIPRYEILRVYFVARFLAKGLQRLSNSPPDRAIAEALSRNSTGQSQVAEWVAWQLKKLPQDRLEAAITHAFEIIDSPENVTTKVKAGSALCHLISLLIDEEGKNARTDQFARLTGCSARGEIRIARQKVFAGKLRSFDFTSFLFEACTFVDVDFSNCIFSKATAFIGCTFEGGLDFSNCTDIGGISFEECRASPEADLSIAATQSREANADVLRGFAEEALNRALRKFRGDLGFHAIQARRRLAGVNPRNPFNQAIWDALRKYGVVGTHEISGVSDGGLHMVDDKDVRRESQQYLDNGIIGPRLKLVLGDLI